VPADHTAAHLRAFSTWAPYASDIWPAKVTVGGAQTKKTPGN
jgi:hypothetical protein